MICQPNKWSDTEFGGYLLNSIEKKSLITGIGINNEHTIKNLDKLYNAVNYLNSIRFKINTEVLDFILWNKDLVFKDYYKLNDTFNENTVNDNILRDTVTIEIAKTFSDCPFYLNIFADWRGRIYTTSYYLSYQSS
jgi:DNA-directed RNA polymerase